MVWVHGTEEIQSPSFLSQRTSNYVSYTLYIFKLDIIHRLSRTKLVLSILSLAIYFTWILDSERNCALSFMNRRWFLFSLIKKVRIASAVSCLLSEQFMLFSNSLSSCVLVLKLLTFDFLVVLKQEIFASQDDACFLLFVSFNSILVSFLQLYVAPCSFIVLCFLLHFVSRPLLGIVHLHPHPCAGVLSVYMAML